MTRKNITALTKPLVPHSSQQLLCSLHRTHNSLSIILEDPMMLRCAQVSPARTAIVLLISGRLTNQLLTIVSASVFLESYHLYLALESLDFLNPKSHLSLPLAPGALNCFAQALLSH